MHSGLVSSKSRSDLQCQSGRELAARPRRTACRPTAAPPSRMGLSGSSRAATFRCSGAVPMRNVSERALAACRSGRQPPLRVGEAPRVAGVLAGHPQLSDGSAARSWAASFFSGTYHRPGDPLLSSMPQVRWPNA
jgi:hypothetical protein